jgi:membrane fusion protein (multidrug efflux system)
MKSGAGRKKILLPVILGVLVAGLVAAGLYFNGIGGASANPGEEAGNGAEAAADANGESVANASKKSEKGEENADKEKKTPIPVNVTSIARGPVSSYITSTGNLVSENEVRILAESEGRITELLVEEGVTVKKGQILAVLVRDDAEIALKKAELKVTNTDLARQRAERMVAQDLMSHEVFEDLRMEAEIARQELAEAQWRLDKTEIRAPFGGRITERVIQLGHHCKLADPLFTIADFDPLITLLYLPERDIFGLREGRDVRITLKANESVEFAGRIRQISPVVDTATGTVKVTVEAVNPPRDVRPGTFVTIDIVRETHHEAVLVPRDAIVRELQEAFVFVAKGDVAE